MVDILQTGLYYAMIDYILGTKYRINLKFDTVIDIDNNYHFKPIPTLVLEIW